MVLRGRETSSCSLGGTTWRGQPGFEGHSWRLVFLKPTWCLNLFLNQQHASRMSPSRSACGCSMQDRNTFGDISLNVLFYLSILGVLVVFCCFCLFYFFFNLMASSSSVSVHLSPQVMLYFNCGWGGGSLSRRSQSPGLFVFYMSAPLYAKRKCDLDAVFSVKHTFHV